MCAAAFRVKRIWMTWMSDAAKTKRLKSASKHISYVLRHRPDAIGLHVDKHGWARIADLIEKSDIELTRNIVEDIVRTSDKQRFSISSDGARIRANQGHSFAVDLGLMPRQPPDLLFHGTAGKNLESIRAKGLERRTRQHVHLSSDQDTAILVGQRHGRPIVLKVQAGRMHASGHDFFLSENGVWLTEAVPTRFLIILDSTS